MENLECLLNDVKKVIRYDPMAVKMENNDTLIGAIRQALQKGLKCWTIGTLKSPS